MRPAGRLDVVDRGAGWVQAAGSLTEQGADLLRGVALALQGRGHSRVVLDLAGVQTADAAGLRVLRATQATMTADLVVVHAPTEVDDPAGGRPDRPDPGA